MMAELIATICAGLFAGAAVYISAVQHPAALALGPAFAVQFFGTMYPRAAAMQAPLAVVGSVAALWCWWSGGGRLWLLGGALLGFVVPFTLLVMMATNNRLQSPELDPSSSPAAALLATWARLHAVRSVTSSLAFLIFLTARARS